MSDSMNKQAIIERLREQLAQAEADRDNAREMLGKCEFALSRANKHGAQADKELEQASFDRDVLAAEVRANRAVTSMAADGENHGNRWNLACKARRLAIEATDASGALDRAKPNTPVH